MSSTASGTAPGPQPKSIFGVTHSAANDCAAAGKALVRRCSSPVSPSSPKTPNSQVAPAAANIFGVHASPGKFYASPLPPSPSLEPTEPKATEPEFDDGTSCEDAAAAQPWRAALSAADDAGIFAALGPDVVEGLVVDLCCSDYAAEGTWRNRISTQPDAHVPLDVVFDGKEKAFLMSSGGNVISVPLPTSGISMREVSYAMWIKQTSSHTGNLAWVMAQSPDYGWSRALTLNDYRLGHVSITTSDYWDSGLGRAPCGRWFHIVGVWRQGGESTVYLDGVRGNSIIAKNGKGNDPLEAVIIGGRAAYDPVHNAAVHLSSVRIYSRALGDEEVRRLHSRGRCPQRSGGAGRPTSEWSCSEEAENDAPLQSMSHPEVIRKGEAAHAPPVWDEDTRLFWCSTGVNAYDLPDGSEWQVEFRAKVRARLEPESGTDPIASKRALRPQVSDTPEPRSVAHNVFNAMVSRPAAGQPGDSRRGRRGLARYPSDPEQRAIRAAHSSALQLMARKPGQALALNGRKVALFRFGERVYAVDAECPHQGGLLADGEVGDIEDMVDGKRCYVTCPVHKFRFDLASGAVIEGTCSSLPIYAVRIRDVSSKHRIAVVEVGFESLSADFFADFDVDDF